MGNSNLTVSVSADVTDLQTKLALAQAAYTKNSAELRKLAQDMNKAAEVAKAGLLPGMQSAATATAAAKIQVAQLSAEFAAHIPRTNEAANAHKKFGGVLAQNRVAFAELGHSARSVVDGLASGIDPVRLFGMEFARVGQALTEFNSVSMATVARFGAIGAAVAAAGLAVYGFYQHLVRARAEASLSTDLAALGTNLPTAKIHEMNAELRVAGYSFKELSQLTVDEKLNMIRSFSEITHGSAAMTQSMIEMVPGFAQVFGVTAPEAVKKLTADMNDLTGSGGKTMESMHLSTAELARFQTAASENPKQGMIIYLDTLRTRLDQATGSMQNAANTSRSLMGLLAEQGDSLARALHGDFSSPTRQERTQATNRQADANLEQAKTQIPNNIAPDEGAVQARMEKMEQDTAKTRGEIIAGQAAYLKKLIDNDSMSGAQRVALNRRYEELIYQDKVAVSAETLEALRTRALQASAVDAADRAKSIADQRRVLQEGLSDERLTADAKLELRKQLAQLDVREARSSAGEAKKSAQEVWHEYVAGIEEQIEADKGHFDLQIALVKQWVAKAKAAYGENSVNYHEAMKKLDEIDNERTAAAQAAAEKQANIQRNLAEAQATLDKIGSKATTGEFKPSIGLVFDDSKMNAEVAGQIAKLKEVLDTQLAGLQASIQGKLSLPKPDVEGASADYAKLTAAMQQFSDKATALNERAAEAVKASWEKITAPIGQAFDSVLSSVMTSHERIGVAVERAAGQMIIGWAKAGMKVVVQWAATELQKTFLTRAGEAARTAAAAPAEAATIARLGAQVASTAASQTAQTGAVVTGVATRTTAEVTGAMASRAAQTAINKPLMQGYAAKAAAGAYSAVAGIPYVGPILAPIAATVAFGAVSAYDAVASAEGGWDRVPYDGAPAILHKNEMVLPAHLAEGVRSMTAGGVQLPSTATPSLGGSSSTVHNGGDTSHNVTINHSPTINAHGGTDSAAMASMLRQSHSALHSTLRGWYGKGSVKLPGR